MIKTHDFDHLNEWALLSDEELQAQCSNDSLTLLKQVVDLLGNEQEAKAKVSSESFVANVRAMRRRYEEGSLSLGQAILDAGDFVEQGDTDKALQVYARFIEQCPSKFYCDIAMSEMEKLRN